MAGALPSLSPSCCTPACDDPVSVAVPGPPGDDAVPCTPCEDGENAYTTFTVAFTMPVADGASSAVATVGSTAWMAVNEILYAAKTDGSVIGYFRVTAIGSATSVTLLNLENTATGVYADNSAPGTIFTIGSKLQPGGAQGPAGLAASTSITGQVTGTLAASELTVAATIGALPVGNGSEAAPLIKGTEGHALVVDTATFALDIGYKAIVPITGDANLATDRVARLSAATGLPIPLKSSLASIKDSGGAGTLVLDASYGNARGADAVDLQTTHSGGGVAVTQVASGQQSVIAGGRYNTAAAIRSVISGGDTNTINAAAQEGVIAGGTNNSIAATGIQGVIGGGDTNSLAGEESVIGGGDTNSTGATAENGTVGGGKQNAVNALEGTIAGGRSNTVAGIQAVIGGGTTNSAAGLNATIGGGTTNTASQVGATIGGGGSNVASGQYATVPGGNSNTASGDVSVAMGYGAVANKYGQIAHAAGFITAPGDTQASELVLRNQTTNATPTELFLTGASRATVPNNTSWMFSILLVARTAAGLDAIYKSEGVIRNNAETTSVNAVTTTEVYDGAALPATPVVVDADDPNDALRITVTGIALTTIRWVAWMRLVEVGH